LGVRTAFKSVAASWRSKCGAY